MTADAQAELDELKREFRLYVTRAVNTAIKDWRRQGMTDEQIGAVLEGEFAPWLKARWDEVFIPTELRLAGVTFQ
jgi:hypothetical protein